jgi:hypothetical protein
MQCVGHVGHKADVRKITADQGAMVDIAFDRWIARGPGPEDRFDPRHRSVAPAGWTSIHEYPT